MDIKKIFSRLFTSKRPFRLTRPGWVFILYAIGVGAGAINTGNNLLYIVFGIFLGLLLASGILSDLSLWGLDVAWIFPSQIYASERVDVWITVTNSKRWWSSLGVSIIFEGTLAGQVVRFSAYAPCVRKNEALRLPATWTPDHRGEFVLTQIRVSTRYPFGLLEKWWRIYRGTPPVQALVQPIRVPLSQQVLWHAQSGDERTSSRHAFYDGSSSSTVRDYHDGDSPRRIHWRASAKRGGLDQAKPSWLVRQMEPEEQHRVILDIPAHGSFTDRGSIANERFVVFVASLHQKLLERGWQVDLQLDHRWILEPLVFFALWNPHLEWTRGTTPILPSMSARGVNTLALFDKSMAGALS